MAAPFQIARLAPDNFKYFHRLFSKVFGKQHSLVYLQQKYDTAYLGEAYQYLGYLAFNQTGEAISYSGHIPYRLCLGGRSFIGAHSCDHMTLPEARGQGIFSQLTRQAEALVEQLGIPLIFGFPNQNNHPLLVKYANWEIIDFMQVFSFPVATFPLGSLVRRLPLLQPAFNAWEHFCLRNYPMVATISSNEGKGLARDRAFFVHKRRSDLQLRQFQAGKVWLKVKGALFIGDIALVPGATLAQLMDELQRYARRLLVNKLLFMCSTNHPLVHDFRSLAPSQFQGNGVGIKRLHLSPELDPAELIFTLGDYDTF